MLKKYDAVDAGQLDKPSMYYIKMASLRKDNSWKLENL